MLYDEGEEPLKIIDPQKNNEEIFSAKNYLEIVDYLFEEGYTRVVGRMDINPGADDWPKKNGETLRRTLGGGRQPDRLPKNSQTIKKGLTKM